MSERFAKNIEYFKFLTSVEDEDDKISCSKLEIPEFQRNYVWKSNNIKDLFDSIKDNDKNYYLGNIVIIKDGSGRSKVVDGQQRLVSLSMIAKDLMSKSQDDQKHKKLKGLIWAGEGVSRILFQKENLNELYKNIIHGIDFDESKLDTSQEILLKSFKSIQIESKKIANIDEFVDKFLSLEFVVIISPSDEDAYQLFEGLNSTGLSLSAVELTKNAVLGKIKILDKSKINEATLLWDSIEKNFESINLVWFSKFLRHQWFSKNGYVGNSNLFRDIKKEIINNKNTTIDTVFKYLQELKEDSAVYISLRTGDILKKNFDLRMQATSWDNISKLIQLISKLGLDQIYSVLLALYKYGKNEKLYFERGGSLNEHIRKIWQFLLITKYTKVSPSSFERDFADICTKIQGKNYKDFKLEMDNFFEKLILKVSGLEDDFSNTLNESLDYSIDDRGIVRFILEDYLTTAGQGSDSNIETEHIVSETNLDEWVNVSDKENLKKFVNKLGNLTLLNKDLNSDAGCKNFDEKSDIAYSKSKFTVNNNLKKEWGLGFNTSNPVENAINPRGIEIARNIYNQYLKI